MSSSIDDCILILENKDLKFKESIPERLKCVICHNILKDARQTICGCKTCFKCITNYFDTPNKPCPGQQTDCENLDKTKINLDNATNKEILRLVVICIFEGCDQELNIREMSFHVKECDHRLIKCNKCGKNYSCNKEKEHLVKICEMRDVECEHCEKLMKAKQLENHLNADSSDLCSKYQVNTCPNKCGAKGPLLLLNHIQTCPNKRIDCPYNKLNCGSAKMNKQDLNEHLNKYGNKHTEELIERILTLEKQLESMTKELEKQKHLMIETTQTSKTTSQRYTELTKSVEDIKRMGTSPYQSSLVSPEKPVLFRKANFIWKVTEYSVKKGEAECGSKVSITSDPFYTSEFGYKMCLRIYPNGDGVGRQSHLSVFFALMKGDYDELLVWPFRQKVTLSLLDQEGNGKHHSDTFKPDARSACYQKPTDECNIASGSPKFIKISEMMASSNYYKHDVIFLKISVDTTNISAP